MQEKGDPCDGALSLAFQADDGALSQSRMRDAVAYRVLGDRRVAGLRLRRRRGAHADDGAARRHAYAGSGADDGPIVIAPGVPALIRPAPRGGTGVHPIVSRLDAPHVEQLFGQVIEESRRR